MRHWWQQFFDQHYLPFLQQRSPQHMLEIATRISHLVHLPPSATIYDQCCGIGQLTHAFASLGHKAWGCDANADYIALAQQQTGTAGFSCADATHYTPPTPCDAVINWYTSFGYSSEIADHAAMMKSAYNALISGGRYLIETYHLPYVLAHFEPITSVGSREDGTKIMRYNHIDTARNMLVSHWHYLNGEHITHHATGESYMHSPESIMDLLYQVGFCDKHYYADAHGAPLTADSPRCVIIAYKP